MGYRHVDIYSDSMEEAVKSMVRHYLSGPQNIEHMKTCFRDSRSLPDASIEPVADFAYGFVSGFMFAINQIIVDELKLETIQIDKHGEESNGNT